jgi:hypothetical protein
MQNVIWGVIELWLHGANRAPGATIAKCGAEAFVGLVGHSILRTLPTRAAASSRQKAVGPSKEQLHRPLVQFRNGRTDRRQPFHLLAPVARPVRVLLSELQITFGHGLSNTIALYLVRTRTVLSERRERRYLRLSRWLLREQARHPFGRQRRRKCDSQWRSRVVRHQDSFLHEFRNNSLRLPHSRVQDFGDLSSR